MITFDKDDNPKKVRIVPQTEEAKEWCAMLPKASLRIRKGCERFALKAFSLWKEGQGTKNLAARMAAAKEAIDKEIRCSNATDPDSVAVVTCSALMKHVFRTNFKQAIVKTTKDNDMITIQLRAEGITAQGREHNIKKATAKAARAFVRVVEKQARRQNKETL